MTCELHEGCWFPCPLVAEAREWILKRALIIKAERKYAASGAKGPRVRKALNPKSRPVL